MKVFAFPPILSDMRRLGSFWGVLYGLGFLCVGWLAWTGWPYYRLPQQARVHHPLHWTWKPGGSVGHLLGIVGSTMMVVMLVYSLRKRSRWMRGWGNLRQWLNLHMFLGVFGPLLVVLHSTFRVHGLVALSFWSMVVVALSGVLGRYLYVQIPRTRRGVARTRDDLIQELHSLEARLRREREVELPRMEAMIHELARVPDPHRAAPVVLIRLLIEDLRRPWTERRVLGNMLAEIPPERRKEVARMVREAAQLERRIALFDRMQEIFHYWHVFHKPFAAVMYLFMVVHVVVALWTGYGW